MVRLIAGGEGVTVWFSSITRSFISIFGVEMLCFAALGNPSPAANSRHQQDQSVMSVWHLSGAASSTAHPSITRRTSATAHPPPH
ncbi:hypothetical protein E2C01_087867 [Portunus trituberculatus]|uniref:Uncharacterized protein n=1 Tax=Portunus trituberculatus TaxID=210409 RepID=A0A5B7J4N0_PORTR|nr:hypothetical protein [Portunus trituberculatus]